MQHGRDSTGHPMSDPHHLFVDKAWDMLVSGSEHQADSMDDDEIPQFLEQDMVDSFISAGTVPVYACEMLTACISS